jgi:extracellular factor (EF) 3-hydroxypalmitic acid methyl ester biosynthesis protein
MKHETLIANLISIVQNGGPEIEEYDELTRSINSVEQQIRLEESKHEQLVSLVKECEFLQDEKSIMGHIKKKPFGYAGDFLIIDRIYTNKTSKEYPKWDNYSLQNSAAQAVRNRKSYFKSVVVQKLSEGDNLLNIASGPARDLYELFNENPSLNIDVTCVEMDPKAIEYAEDLNKEHLDKIEFIEKNIFKFQTEEKFNLIWSSGLFDYFDDRAFVLMLRRLKEWLHAGGEIIVGNFNEDNNPSRIYMELFGEWYLNHRTEEHLISLAIQAGYKEENIIVGREPENVNLFLHIKNR